MKSNVIPVFKKGDKNICIKRVCVQLRDMRNSQCPFSID